MGPPEAQPLVSRRSVRPLLFLLATALCTPLARAQQPAAEIPRPRRDVTAEQIQGWVADLSADEFLVRETAMLELAAVGADAIPAIKGVLAGGSLEATTRALHVLQQLGLSPDERTQEAAREALVEAAARRENGAVARRAAAVLADLLKLRSAQALAQLEQLGADVVRAQALPGLSEEITVESIEIGPAFRGEAADLRRLQWVLASKVVLAGERVTDEWLKQAAAMTEIDELHLYQTAVTDQGLAAIAEHPSIRQLGLYYTPLTGAALDHVQKLPLLSFVKLYGTKVPRADAEKFQLATGLPKEKVDHRKGAFLGVGCLNGACVISTVHMESPAGKAGLMRDDILIRFGDTKVDTFETLTGMISKLDAGDEIEIEVQRQIEDERGAIRTKNVVVKATLAPWPLKAAVENGARP